MKHITQIVAASIGLALAGCSTGGLPRGAHVVGGGLNIQWSPPGSESGTAILVEKTTGKTIMTKALVSPDRTFRFDITGPNDETVWRTALGFNIPTNAQYVLYFVPRQQK